MRKEIRITSAIYADKKKTVTPNAFARLLRAAGEKVVPFAQDAPPSSARVS